MQQPKARAHFLLQPDYYHLNNACVIIRRAFPNGYGIYLVGSVLSTPNFRDVDLRLILPNEEFDKLFPQHDFEHRILDPLWSLMCSTITDQLRAQTRLPVDFQIQRASNANAEHGGKMRNAVGHTYGRYPGGG